MEMTSRRNSLQFKRSACGVSAARLTPLRGLNTKDTEDTKEMLGGTHTTNHRFRTDDPTFVSFVSFVFIQRRDNLEAGH
jgi:hypothetical protein